MSEDKLSLNQQLQVQFAKNTIRELSREELEKFTVGLLETMFKKDNYYVSILKNTMLDDLPSLCNERES